MNPKDQVKELLSITDVVSTYIRLEKSGNQFRARCPFHNEKTPSFYVSPERRSYHCFGCSEHGDIFSFVEKIENIPFFDALKILADRAGVSLQDDKRNKEDSRLVALLKEATIHFENNFNNSAEAKKYISDRGITEETIKTFHIGFAKNEWRDLFIYLASKGYSPEEMEQAGVTIKTDKGFYDRFRGRVMFPIRNVSGATVGFSGRILPAFVDPTKEAGKYVNTPETPLYHKSKILFGYDTAKKGMHEKKEVVVVEGQMDLCMSYQAGVYNTVAVSGTAFTDEHINLVKRFCDKVILSFDTDNAGQNALKKTALMCLFGGLDVYVVDDIGTKDPADLILQNKDLWIKAIENRKHIIEFITKKVLSENKDEREAGRKIVLEVLPFIRAVQSPVDRNYFIKLVSNKSKINEQTLLEELSRGISLREEVEEITNTAPKMKSKEKLARELMAFIHWKNLFDDEMIKDLNIDKNQFPDAVIQEEIFVLEEKLIGNHNSYIKDLIRNYKKEMYKEELEILKSKLKDEDVNSDEILKEIYTIATLYKNM